MILWNGYDGGMKLKNWRAKSRNILNTRPIYEAEFPALAKAMVEDGLTFRIVSKGNGYQWLVADYEIPAKSVRQVWGLTAHQMRRFIDWLLAGSYTELIEWE